MSGERADNCLLVGALMFAGLVLGVLDAVAGRWWDCLGPR